MRVLIFSKEEILRGLVDYLKSRGTIFPKGAIAGVDIISAKEIKATLRINPEAAANGGEYKFPEEDLKAALIFYCIHNKIPLPINAPKILKILDGNISITIAQRELKTH